VDVDQSADVWWNGWNVEHERRRWNGCGQLQRRRLDGLHGGRGDGCGACDRRERDVRDHGDKGGRYQLQQRDEQHDNDHVAEREPVEPDVDLDQSADVWRNGWNVQYDGRQWNGCGQLQRGRLDGLHGGRGDGRGACDRRERDVRDHGGKGGRYQLQQ